MKRRSLILGLAGTTLSAAPKISFSRKSIRVLVWSEGTEPAEVYPKGIHGAIAEGLNAEKRIQAYTSSLSDRGQGLTEELVSGADVLVAFGSRYHKVVTEENADRIVRHVEQRGMGYLPVHSSFGSRAFEKIMGIIARRRGVTLDRSPCWTRIINEGKAETIRVSTPKHPLVKGISDFTIPRCETYYDPFFAPSPDLKLLEGEYEGGPSGGSEGLLWVFGRGQVFYFRPGHEAYPIFFQPEVRKLLASAARFLAH